MEEGLNLINICPTKPIQVLNLQWFLDAFVRVLQMMPLTKEKKIDVGTGAPHQRQEVPGIKQT